MKGSPVLAYPAPSKSVQLRSRRLIYRIAASVFETALKHIVKRFTSDAYGKKQVETDIHEFGVAQG